MEEIKQKNIAIKGVGSLFFIDFVIAASDEQGVDWVRLESLAREARRHYTERLCRVCQSDGLEKKTPDPFIEIFLHHI